MITSCSGDVAFDVTVLSRLGERDGNASSSVLELHARALSSGSIHHGVGSGLSSVLGASSAHGNKAPHDVTIGLIDEELLFRQDEMSM